MPEERGGSSSADPHETFDFRGRRTGTNLGFGQQSSASEALLTWDKLRQVLHPAFVEQLDLSADRLSGVCMRAELRGPEYQ